MKITQGTYTALVTPFLEPEGDIDFRALENLVNIQIENRIGLVILGTTAETPTLNEKEKKEIITLSIKQAKDQVPIIIGTGTPSTKSTIEETKKAENSGADGALIVTPYYNKPTQKGIIKHFEATHNNTNIPIIVYNIAGRTGVNIETETLKEISKLERIIGVKEASGNINQMMEVRNNLPKDFLIFSGDDLLTYPMMTSGANGVISVMSNLYPKKIKEMVNYLIEKEDDFAKTIHYQLLPITKSIFSETNPIGIKYALFLKGLINETYRLPLCEMSEENKLKIKMEMKKWKD